MTFISLKPFLNENNDYLQDYLKKLREEKWIQQAKYPDYIDIIERDFKDHALSTLTIALQPQLGVDHLTLYVELERHLFGRDE